MRRPNTSELISSIIFEETNEVLYSTVQYSTTNIKEVLSLGSKEGRIMVQYCNVQPHTVQHEHIEKRRRRL